MRSIEHKISEVYSANFDIIAEGFPARINGARAGFMEDFMLAGLPSFRDERFLQSDMQALFGAEEREIYFTRPHREASFGPSPDTVESFETLLVPGIKTVVFENGFFDGSAIKTGDNGAFCGSIRDVFPGMFPVEQCEKILTAYNSLADNQGDALTALNSAFMQDSALVWVPAGVRLVEPLFLDFRFLSEEEALMCFGRTLIVLGEGAEADISILYRTSGDTRFLIDFVREIVVGKGARLTLSECSLAGRDSALLVNSYMRQGSHSRTKSIFTNLGHGFSRLSLGTELAGEHAEVELHGLYIASERAHSDIEVRLNHLSPDCHSRQLVKGIAAGEATGVFSGMVYVARDARGTDAAQQNRNLQLTDTARIFARPQLEIYADDVKCGHGATIGRLDEEAIYYMRQRGVGESEARRMQIQGFAGDIINRCPSAHFREFISEKAEKVIETF